MSPPLGALRRAARRLPLAGPALRRLRALLGAAFTAAAFARLGRRRTPQVLKPGAGPVVVAGFHASVLGLGDGARAFSAALRAAGAPVVDWDVTEVFGHERTIEGDFAAAPPPGEGPLVVHLNPRELIQLAAMKGAGPFAGRFTVGYWAWELERIPPAWRAAFRYVDEVWTPSRFVADAVRADAPARVAVRVFPHLVARLPVAPPDRARFGPPAEGALVLLSFDARSGFERKNPLGAVEAFRRAKAKARVPASFVVKVVGAEAAPAQMAALRAAAEACGDVRVMTERLSGEAMAALIASADIVLSLHRSEGFGLLLAQAMAAGKPVVATDWSGALDFMTADSAALIGRRLVEVKDPQSLYAGGRWAEPDLEEAADRLATLIADPDARRALGARAAATAAERLDPAAWARRARDWLGV